MFEALDDVSAAEVLGGFASGHVAAGAVAGGAEGEPFAGCLAGEYERSGAHSAADEDGLADLSVFGWDALVAGAPGAGGAFAVDEETLALAVDGVLLDFAGVVGDVVKEADVGFAVSCSKAWRVRWVRIWRLANAQLMPLRMAPR